MRNHLLVLCALSALGGCVDATGGEFDASWSITINNQPAACADVGATQTSILSTEVGTSSGNDDIFRCDDGGGITDTYPAGDYTIVVTLLDDNDVAVSNPSAPVNATIHDGETTTIDALIAF